MGTKSDSISRYEKPLIEQLRSIEVGSTLYKVYAKERYVRAFGGGVKQIVRPANSFYAGTTPPRNCSATS